MRVYWSLKDIPELTRLAPSERRDAWMQASHKSLRHWQVWGAIILFVAGTCAGSWLGSYAGSSEIGALIAGAIAFLGFHHVHTAYVRRYLTSPN